MSWMMLLCVGWRRTPRSERGRIGIDHLQSNARMAIFILVKQQGTEDAISSGARQECSWQHLARPTIESPLTPIRHRPWPLDFGVQLKDVARTRDWRPTKWILEGN